MPRPLVTARDVQDHPNPVIPPGAILTPLARDVLRKRGLLPHALGEGGGARDTLVVANWKSHKTVAEALAFAEAFKQEHSPGSVGVVICPPFTALLALGHGLGNAAEIGAQDVSLFGEGAHTGEIAARHLVEVGCAYVIVGHSERRHAGETDEQVRRKTRVALEAGLRPILCVGETKDERTSGRAESVVSRQLEAALSGLDPAGSEQVLVAYEPRWAIGTGLTPTTEDVASMLAHVRRALERIMTADVARVVPVLYGGSVKPNNAAELLSLPGCGGALVGGAALHPDKLAAIAAAAGR